MSNADAHTTVLALRREFDAAFAAAPRTATAQRENLLAIRLAGDPFALRVAQIAGLYADKPVSPLPTPVHELKGLAGFRGRVAPVYDLAALLGYGAAEATRWLALARATEPLALAFEKFEAHFSVAAADVVRAPGKTLKIHPSLQPQIFDAARYEGAMRPIIDLESIVENIRRRCTVPAQPRSAAT